MSTILIFQCAELSSAMPVSKGNICGVQQSQEGQEGAVLFCWVCVYLLWFVGIFLLDTHKELFTGDKGNAYS